MRKDTGGRRARRHERPPEQWKRIKKGSAESMYQILTMDEIAKRSRDNDSGQNDESKKARGVKISEVEDKAL